jgi:antitoxin ParD1/3/4
MSNVEKISVALTPEIASEMRAVVESGEYASASEVMRDALREWRLRRAERKHAREQLGRLWDEGMASGPSAEGEEAFTRIRRKLELRTGNGPDRECSG